MLYIKTSAYEESLASGRNKTELDRVKTMVSELRDTFREANKNAKQEMAAAASQPADTAEG